jgi:mono/diheme cytochrome c family protein
MPPNPSNERGRKGPLAAAALALVSVVLVTVWLGVRAAESRRLTQELAAWADTPLPAPGASVDPGLAEAGAAVFERHCAACHAVTGAPKLGPNLAGVTLRREAPWIQAMILRPDSMTRDDPVAASLKARYGVQMLVVGKVDGTGARAVIEFLRRVDAQAGR